MRLDSIAAAIEMVNAGKVDAYAAPRVVLLTLSSRAPGSRVLDDSFANISLVAMVPKGKGARAACVSDFIEETKAIGLVKQIVEQANIRGVKVVPPGKVN